MANKYTDEELQGLVKSPGWGDDKGSSGTLEDLLRASHERHRDGAEPSLIRQLENSIELDLLQVEKLWRYLGLPV